MKDPALKGRNAGADEQPVGGGYRKWLRRGLFFVIALAVSISARAGEALTARYPHARLSRGGVDLIVCLPDAQNGIYRGVRFDRSGFVARATYRGHTWFGPWHDMADPHRNDNVLGTAGEFGMGTNGMPAPLGFDEAEQGGPFLKIGVGILKKQGDSYRFPESYDVVRAGDWAIESTPESIRFEQQAASEAGYGYRYEKRIVLSGDVPGFCIEYELENTGSRTIEQTYYAHNFVKIDDQPIGPGYSVTFPQAMAPDREMKGIVLVEENRLAFNRRLEPGESVYTQFRDHDLPAAANGFLIRQAESHAGIRVRGSAGLARYHFWATEQVVCPEPFVSIRVEPGETFRWNDRYELIVEP